MQISAMEPNICDCRMCQSMCDWSPCMGTPEDMQRLIDLGYSNRLVLVYVQDGPDDAVYRRYLLPSNKPELGGCQSAFNFHGTCTFFKDQRCELHALGLKPSEGRVVTHSTTDAESSVIHRTFLESWDTDEAKAICDQFEKDNNFQFREYSVLEVIFEGLQMELARGKMYEKYPDLRGDKSEVKPDAILPS